MSGLVRLTRHENESQLVGLDHPGRYCCTLCWAAVAVDRFPSKLAKYKKLLVMLRDVQSQLLPLHRNHGVPSTGFLLPVRRSAQHSEDLHTTRFFDYQRLR